MSFAKFFKQPPMQKASSLDQNDNDEPEQTGQENAAEKDADKESTDKEPIVPDGYNPRDYDNLAVSAELKALFKLINNYTPQTIELDNKLRPFIPDLIPAVGDIDAFIKVPPPDKSDDFLGLKVLDEPCAKQSDPTVLNMQLRATTKQSSAKSATLLVKCLDQAHENPKQLEEWISSIEKLHQSRPTPTVHYARPMPDIESLMQEWPQEVEDALRDLALPSAQLSCSLDEYVNIIMAILDIPVYKNKLHSLHVLFTLYYEFKNSQHFRALAMDNQIDNAMKDVTDPSDRLVL
ncbi:intraflagellar transport protein 46 homolog [Varroa jacobsoni]|uniref:Intraflagellar transport protein 46 homolog n=1 Tax=Varroa destructor TaxID=109461 RepID=A0A7M7MJN5_VARDE|nr:intraflagellar transport protein 46 homolog [Varroa destructor]XP_022671971.1 intraflagellar transport protein 46 homolog [Varroa destructor]XP_022671973.1 intraflagellar transport protein 46 homolog [Varroa destructor]XP_022693211.1 intraflagellar transport protein 46 homolog [Varroa jacobsoni]XP_022693212.1 intraflagellar transport protein 46 homolog [Varroa jacobsoni]